MLRGLRVHLMGFAFAAIGFALLISLSAWLVRPDLTTAPVSYSEEDLAAAEELRDVSLNPDNPLVLVRDVDYSEGPSADWYPKGESPVLTDLVERSLLPPVADRVGPEPIVVEGVEGIGKYGGTWTRVATSPVDVDGHIYRMAYAGLFRFSPQGYPIVAHLAKGYEASSDNREFVFELRRGMKWSDGHPFTADDILYYWNHEILDPAVTGVVPPFMKIKGKAGSIEKIDDFHLKFTFPEPYGLFPALMASPEGTKLTACPAHYLRRFHPVLGDKKLIEETMRSRNLESSLSVYLDVKKVLNPEHPRMWPWIYRTYRPNAPQSFVRNPYYYMVDTQGNQLPYIDRLVIEESATDMVAIKAANGEITMQGRHIYYEEYTHLMNQRAKGGYEVYHWYPGEACSCVISPNLNRKVDPNQPETGKKHELLNDGRFRQALSLAINRQDIIDAQYNGQAEPAQVAPGPESPFHEPLLFKSFVEYDPERANQLLDEIGLTERDYEGYRAFKDGSRMTFFLEYCEFTGAAVAQFVCDDWGAVGVRVIPRERARRFFYTQKVALLQDFNIWTGNSEFMAILEPRHFVPVVAESNFAQSFARWYMRGGLYGDPRANTTGCIEPPEDHPTRRAMEIYDEVCGFADLAQQQQKFREILRIAAENVWTISVCNQPPTLTIVKDGLRNVPRTAVAAFMFLVPANTGVETYFFESPHDSPGAIAQIKEAVLKPSPRPDSVTAALSQDEGGSRSACAVLTALLRYLSIAILVAVLLAISLRHPFVARRLPLMVPTLLLISVVAFTIIQLPPGDYLTVRIMELEASGDVTQVQQLEDLKKTFYLEDPLVKRYARWLGLFWFVTFDSKDSGLLQGNMGRSMENSESVNSIVGDRILLTVFISLGTILFTWAVALPIGIYSAVRQYSVGDYVLTLIGFVGMCVPPFLLALILMYFSSEFLGIPVSGLFSAHYGAQPEWTWGKFADLLKHIWVPIVVLGVGGTASMIRVMRGNLLDELKKPYVITAMAKGVRPTKLLLKYPVRLALNPFVSGIGSLFPQLVSGGAIVAMVLSLPTVGPLMLSALMAEDMYLAGSMLMTLSLLGVFGTLVSDLLLLWLDPRIRFKGGTR